MRLKTKKSVFKIFNIHNKLQQNNFDRKDSTYSLFAVLLLNQIFLGKF